jgi:hypothetical protein
LSEYFILEMGMDLHQYFVKAVVKDLEVQNGTNFEYMCQPLMEILTDSEVILKGHNLYMKPVGYSVDLIKDAKTVGQCGTDEKYFTNGKPLSDIEGCVKNSPGCKFIYLFVNKRATGGEYQLIQREIEIKYCRLHVELYDAQRIGEVLYHNIFRTTLIERILRFLPEAKRYYLIMPQTNNVPLPSPNYVNRPEEVEVYNLLEEKQIVQVYGLSGIGKSQLVMSIAGKHGGNYDTVLWFDGDKVNANDFASIYTNRLGESINLKTVLGQFRILLVVDNLNEGVRAFMANFLDNNKKGSRCIVTSLQKNLDEEHSFKLSYVDDGISKQILYSGTKRPTEEQAGRLLKEISGYPLLLELAKNTVDNGDFGWDELIEISNLTGISDEERNVAFAERIVGRYRDGYSDLFNTIIMLGSLRISSGFLKSIDVFKLKDLVRFAILQSNEEFSCQIHVVVLNAIRKVMDKDRDANGFRQLLYQYLRVHVQKRDAELYVFMKIHGDACLDLTEELEPSDELRHYIVLAVCYTMDTYQDHDRFIGMIDALNTDFEKHEIDLNLLIERMEIVQNKQYIVSGKDESVKKQTILKDIDHLNSLSYISDNQKALVYHHIGKWLLTIHEEKDGEEYLKKAIAIVPCSYSSRLQLARLYNRQNRKDGVIQMIGELLKEESLKDVPVSVLLSAYGLLAPSKYADLCKQFLDKQLDTFVSTVYASLSQGYTHTYLELAKLSRHLAYNYPEEYNQLCSRLPLPLDIANDMRLRENYGIIIAAQFRYCNNESEYRDRIFHKAEKYLLMTDRDNDFKRKNLFDLYIAAGKADEALAEAKTYDNQNDIYLHQGLSKVFRIKGNYTEALKHIDYAIANENDAYIAHKSAFRHDKGLCLKGLGDEKWQEVMAEAIEMQPNEKVKSLWIGEMNS